MGCRSFVTMLAVSLMAPYGPSQASSQPGAMVDVQAAMESGRKAELVVPTHRLPSGKQVALQVSLTPLAEGSSTGEGILVSYALKSYVPMGSLHPCHAPSRSVLCCAAGNHLRTS